MENKKETMLYPNCSEVVWRLDFTKCLSEKERIIYALQDNGEYTEEIMTCDSDGVPLYNMIDLLEQAKKDGLDINKSLLDIVEDTGGSIDDIHKAFDLATDVMNGKITLEQAEKLKGDYD